MEGVVGWEERELTGPTPSVWATYSYQCGFLDWIL